MKIFLAGASGVIGRSLVPRLAGAGHDVTGMTGGAAAAGIVRSLGARRTPSAPRSRHWDGQLAR
jgi:2-alkyl-3-oxoalkanoate reductase